jgi:WD40 repeat protein
VVGTLHKGSSVPLILTFVILFLVSNSHHFVQHLIWGLNPSMLHVAEAAKERTLAAFVLAAACHEYPPGQSECIRLNLHGNCCALLQSYEQGESAKDDKVELHLPAHFRLWLCICLANVVKENAPAQNESYGAGVQAHLFARLADQNPDVRAAVCYALGCLIGSSPKMGSRSPSSQDLQSLQPKQGGDLSSYATTTSAAASAGLMPQQQRVAQFPTGPNMLVPGVAMAPGQLQPAFAGPTGVPNLQWHGQPMQGMSGQPMQLAQGQHHFPAAHAQQFVPHQHAGQFLSQPVQLRSPQHPMQPQYIMQGQPMVSHPGLTGPTGFLVGAGAVVSQAQPPRFMSHPQQFQQQAQSSPEGRPPLKPTVFDDRRRLELDLSVIEKLLRATDDASVVVRYEATAALARAVGKYLDAFVVVAQELASSGTASKQNITIPRGLERTYIHRFEAVWKVLRSLQHEDPFPAIAKAANQVVSVVHEHVLRFRMESSELATIEDDSFSNILSGIAEDTDGSGGASDHVPKLHHAQTTLQPGAKQWSDSKDLRRVVSEYAGGHSSMEEAARVESSPSTPSNKTFGRTESFSMNYILPKSEFYEWKKNTFDITFTPPEDESDDLDPLSPTGAPRLYRERRMRAARESGRRLTQHFSVLAPKPPKPAKRSIELILEEEDEEALEAAEQEVSAKKKDLDLIEKRVLRNDGVGMTSMLAFHPYEDVLISCGATDDVALWSTESGSRLTRFENGNPKFTRITASNWLNEDSTSLFLVGCDDGRIRIWGNFLESNGRPTCEPPCLVSSFCAAQMTPGERGTSGLITEWQKSGHLLVGGNCNYINCWDLEAEQQVTRLETGLDAACVTTMTTAWDYEALGMGSAPAGSKGIGRDIFVAGFSNGAIKVFDLRASRAAASAMGLSKPNRTRPMSYMEHKSWVVSTSFTGYGSRYELISGTVAGDIKAWDLRMSSSVRTIEAQRSGMTTLAVHPKIPILATGSHAQFIKILTMDGDTLQVVRYHGMMSNHRIGPVSCLSFHPYKPLLAAGATDTFIGLYTTKKLIV